jgi:multidrug efflux pump subunit AcrB
MWIVRPALSRPYTFLVMAVALLIMGPLTILRTPTDIFPTSTSRSQVVSRRLDGAKRNPEECISTL